MTLLRGLLLFDMAETPIGKWENQLGYRGMMEVWKHSVTQDELIIEPIEHDDPWDECLEPTEGFCDCNEVWIHTAKGDIDPLDCFNTFDAANTFAKEWMLEHPHGASATQRATAQ